MAKEQRLAFRADESFKKRIQEAAKDDNRSMSNWVEVKLRETVETYERSRAEAAKALIEDALNAEQRSPAKRKRAN